jgi:hypothetical protein
VIAMESQHAQRMQDDISLHYLVINTTRNWLIHRLVKQCKYKSIYVYLQKTDNKLSSTLQFYCAITYVCKLSRNEWCSNVPYNCTFQQWTIIGQFLQWRTWNLCSLAYSSDDRRVDMLTEKLSLCNYINVSRLSFWNRESCLNRKLSVNYAPG